MNQPPCDPVDLAARLGRAERYLFALDFDGVLAPIVDRPDAARPSPETLVALRALAQRTTVAVVSGRPVTELRSRLGELSITLAGGHGAEVVGPDGSHDQLVDVAELAPTLDELEASLTDLVGDEPGWLVERKAASLAVHHRLADTSRVEELLPRVTAQLEARRELSPGFEVLHGKAVLELRPAGTDKGGALTMIAGWHPELAPLVLGDDTTDEDAFRVATELGGTGVLVAESPRDTLAEHRISDPDAVTDLLMAFVQQGN